MAQYTDSPRTTHATILSHSFTEQSKSLQVQLRDRMVDGSGSTADEQSIVFSDYCAGAWCLIAVPDAPTMDTDGSVKEACEALASEDADDLTVFGTRDVRYAKFAQDLGLGECALFNKYGSRLALKGDEVSLVAKGGGFVSLNVSEKLVSVCGFPEEEGKPAPYMTISSDTIGMVSATGKASFALVDNQITLSGQAIALDAGSVSIGKGAMDYVALASRVESALQIIITAFNLHTHGVSGASTSVPGAVIGATSPVRSQSVKCA